MKTMKIIYLLLAILISRPTFAQLREFNFHLESEHPLYIVNLSSVETLPCAGYGIRAFQMWRQDTVIIDIRGFVRPEPCYSGTDIATGRIRLTGIKTRAFVVKFRWKKMEDLWKIAVHGTSFSATPVRTTFTSYSK